MTFWQENYGFVKDVYDSRLQKYNDWMDKLEKIVGKVMAQNVQYTYKEFKIIQDDLRSLTRDLEKEGMKAWLDMMLEKVATKAGGDSEAGLSAKDKELKAAERKKLQDLIDRHDKLMPSTIETQQKVDVYARCYSYGDDIKPVLKTLEEMLHLAVKDIHPHNISMVGEQIDKAEKVIQTVNSQRDSYEELYKRGQKLNSQPNVAPFLGELLTKMENTWKDANEKSQERKKMLSTASTDWEMYDDLRVQVNSPVEKLEDELKRYRKFYEPEVGKRNLEKKRGLWTENKNTLEDMLATIKRCYKTIIVLAGDEKKDFLDKEVAQVEEKLGIIKKCDDALNKLQDYNEFLTKTWNAAHELNDWAVPTQEKLNFLRETTEMTVEDITKERLTLKDVKEKKFPLIAPLDQDYKDMLQEFDLEKSSTARKTLATWEEIKKLALEVCQTIDDEAGKITPDQRLYADYYVGVKAFKPWMNECEKLVKTPMKQPDSLEKALELLNAQKELNALAVEKKGDLDAAGGARDKMEVPSTTENEMAPLTGRWEAAKAASDDRVARVNVLVETWSELQKATLTASEKMADVPKQENPNIEEIEDIYIEMKKLYEKKTELLEKV